MKTILKMDNARKKKEMNTSQKKKKDRMVIKNGMLETTRAPLVTI